MNTLEMKNDCNEILFNSTKYSYLKEYYNVDEIDRAHAFKVLFNDCSLCDYRKTKNEIVFAYNNLYNKIKDCKDTEIFDIIKKSYELLLCVNHLQPSAIYLKIE